MTSGTGTSLSATQSPAVADVLRNIGLDATAHKIANQMLAHHLKECSQPHALALAIRAYLSAAGHSQDETQCTCAGQWVNPGCRIHGEFAQSLAPTPAVSPAPAVECGCWACLGDVPVMQMVVCAICGNKRCPHANDHRNACTHSNAPSQIGSAYEKAPPSPAPAETEAVVHKHHGECATCGEEIGEDHVRHVDYQAGIEWLMGCARPVPEFAGTSRPNEPDPVIFTPTKDMEHVMVFVEQTAPLSTTEGAGELRARAWKRLNEINGDGPTTPDEDLICDLYEALTGAEVPKEFPR